MEFRGMMGERLGVIGQEPESLPAWKRDFLSTPSASIRRGIAWNFQPAYEDTSTLVLTSPSLKFIDIRFPVNSHNPSEAASHPSFWAFSGESSTSFYDAASTDPSPQSSRQQQQQQTHQPHPVDLPYTAHCRFIHAIDTRGPNIVDQGDMCLLPNGDVLEFGSMLNPVSGKIEPYKEYWRSAQPLPCKPNTTLQSSSNMSGNDADDDSKTCLVAQIASPSHVEGLLIRIGGRVQGIMSSRGQQQQPNDNDDRVTGASTTIHVERWTRGEVDLGMGKAVEASSDGVEVDGWYRDIRSSAQLPCAWLIDGDKRAIGENLEYEGVLWNVIEIHR